MMIEEEVRLLTDVVRELVLERQRAGCCNVELRDAANDFLGAIDEPPSEVVVKKADLDEVITYAYYHSSPYGPFHEALKKLSAASGDPVVKACEHNPQDRTYEGMACSCGMVRTLSDWHKPEENK